MDAGPYVVRLASAVAELREWPMVQASINRELRRLLRVMDGGVLPAGAARRLVQLTAETEQLAKRIREA